MNRNGSAPSPVASPVSVAASSAANIGRAYSRWWSGVRIEPGVESRRRRHERDGLSGPGREPGRPRGRRRRRRGAPAGGGADSRRGGIPPVPDRRRRRRAATAVPERGGTGGDGGASASADGGLSGRR